MNRRWIKAVAGVMLVVLTAGSVATPALARGGNRDEHGRSLMHSGGMRDNHVSTQHRWPPHDRWAGDWGYGRHVHGLHHHRYGYYGPGLGFGLLGGALLGSQAPYYSYSADYPSASYVSDEARAYCAARFKSYNPATGTYLGYDGLRHACP